MFAIAMFTLPAIGPLLVAAIAGALVAAFGLMLLATRR
jgi:uncharacterized integral membrane protein